MMRSTQIRLLLDRLCDPPATVDRDTAASWAQEAFSRVLACAYEQVRAAAPPAVMRRLLELEIQIGGEDGDFRDFDRQRIVDLFHRGGAADQLARKGEPEVRLAATVDVRRLAAWLDDLEAAPGPPSAAALRFLQAWLRLLAEAAGILEADDGSDRAPRILSGDGQSAPVELPNGEGVYTEPTTGIQFVFVPGGTYSMGDTFDQGVDDEKPVHEVRMSEFYLAVHPVTQAQWKRLMTDNPARWVHDDHPVEQVTLSDVTAFIDRLNAALPDGLQVDLPSEAQWEYAARSGGKDELYAGGQEPRALAWYDENSGGRTAPVGCKQPNGLGIFDMSGNVWEWCRDLYQPDAYPSHSKSDPVADRVGTDRVIRGGSWNLDAWSTRCSRRFRFDPDLFGPALGFRLVMRVG